ncbi:MAG TPA: histidine ammonia-lyase [Cyclobacteriaceae bacterium]
MTKTFFYGSDLLDVSTAFHLTDGSFHGAFDEAAKHLIEKSAANVQNIIDRGEVVYGVNTGFGPLCTTIINKGQTKSLQENILRSHSVGVGEATPLEVVKLMMITKIHALSKGYSGISMKVLERIQWHLANDIIPLVPQQGSVGASGDLAPLAHLFLPLIGLGKVWKNGVYRDSGEVLKKYQLKPVELGAKEGLALINGTQFIQAFSILGIQRLLNCMDTADIVGAMSLEGVLGSARPFEKELHDIRPFEGSQYVAQRLNILLKNSEMVASHASCGRVQDPYSIRCMPQVHGTVRNAWLHLKELLEIEMNAVTDNPIIISDKKAISGGNFHGELLAVPIDYLSIAACELGNISDRRTYLLLQGGADGLPKLLMKNTGINSGFMIPQYTSAALVAENKSICFPASADSIPTSLGQEDHVSMGSISARKLNQIINNLENILAVEMICAAQAFDYRKPMKSGIILEACHDLIRSRIDHAEEDRVFAEDMNKAREIIISGQLVDTANKVALEKGILLTEDKHVL